ncbi:MAG: hypothetical protein GX442_14000 [Candidatus Riflebacteria bacterium]|nr:hypothetical protein [Candidatus Riflebacteria bacterium]
MKKLFSRVILALVLMAAMPAGRLEAQSAPTREQVGTVLGTPVYRDQIQGGNLPQLFITPVMQRYHEVHESVLKPTPEERKAVQEFDRQRHEKEMADRGPGLRAELAETEAELARLRAKGKLSDDEVERVDELEATKMAREADLDDDGGRLAVMMFEMWKLQRHLYAQYGGGRVLWQQMGVEAFDAMRRFLEDQEKRGSFTVTDPSLRARLYSYWTKDQPGAEDSPDRVRKLLLAPDWIPPAIAAAPPPTVDTDRPLFQPGAAPGSPLASPHPAPPPTKQDAVHACFANQRLLLSAIEMYNMDNPTMITDLTPDLYLPESPLVQGGYLEGPLTLPDPACRYSSTGDLTGDGGTITCAVHGSIPTN